MSNRHLSRAIAMQSLYQWDFNRLLKKTGELKIKESLAKKISDEVNELIFSPVESDLARLYGGNKKPPLELGQKPKRTSGKDTYRETIE